MRQSIMLCVRLLTITAMVIALVILTNDWLGWCGLEIGLLAMVTFGTFFLVLLIPSIGLLVLVNKCSQAHYRSVSTFSHFLTAVQCYCIWQGWPLDGYRYEGGGHYYHPTSFGVGFIVAILVYWATVQLYAHWQLKACQGREV